MPGKGVKGQSYQVPLHQHKTCMAKATLLEPQSQRPKNRGHERRVAEKLVWNIRQIRPSLAEPYCSSVLPMREIKGTNVAPNHVDSPHVVNAGSPKLVAGSVLLPVWRRSSHSTQGWPVMGSAAGKNRTDQGKKWKVTPMKTRTSGGRGTALSAKESTKTRIRECCPIESVENSWHSKTHPKRGAR